MGERSELAAKLHGLVARLHAVAAEPELEWHEPFCFTTWDGSLFHLLGGDHLGFCHDLRALLRVSHWRSDQAYANRQDMQGEILSYEPSVSLPRETSSRKPRHVGSRLSFVERMRFQAIVTGAVYTRQHLHKGNHCLWCAKQVEDVAHIFWVCPRWTELSAPFLRECADVITRAPPCARICGNTPCIFTKARGGIFVLPLDLVLRYSA